MRTEFMAAMNQVASERGIDVSIILESLQHALVAAYKKRLWRGERRGRVVG